MEQHLSLAVRTAREARSPVTNGVCGGPVLVYLLVAVGVVVFLVFLPALSARTVFLDDSMYLAENPLVTHPSWNSVRRFFTEVLHPSTVMGYYQPLTMVSLMVDYALSPPGGGLRVFHRTSLLLHVGNTALVIVLLYLLFGEAWIAAGVGLLFGLHPLTVDSVCWLSERKTVLAAFFALGSLISYVRWTQTGRRRHSLVCLLLYVLGLLSKPITVPLPLAILLLDYWPLHRLSRRAVVEKLPLCAMAAVSAVITYVSQSRTAPVFLPGQYNPVYAPLILCHNIIFYLWKIVWPVHLSPHYGLPHPLGLSHPMVLAGVIGTGVLVSLLLASLRWTRALMTGWLLFFVILSPALGIVSVTPVIAANRYAYLPAVGLLLVLAAGLTGLHRLAGSRPPISPIVPATIMLLAAGGETLATAGYLHHWRDTISLYEHILTIAPNEAILHNGLGVALAHEGKRKEAIAHYREALRISPDLALAHFNLAFDLSPSADKIDEAVVHYRRVLELEPLNYKAHLNLGNLLLLKGNLEASVEQFAGLVRMKPDYVVGRYHLGKTLVTAGRPREGIEHLRKAVDLDSAFLPALKDLAWFLATHPEAQILDPKQAVKLAERAHGLTQGRDAGVLDTLAAAYALDGQYRKAAETAEKARALAKRRRDDQLARQIEDRLQLYQLECPYYENPRAQLDRLRAKYKAGAAKTQAAADPNSGCPIAAAEFTVGD
jgi:tetratricopeptide (TPR) repeat protein